MGRKITYALSTYQEIRDCHRSLSVAFSRIKKKVLCGSALKRA
jgi:hypothetical protein